MRPIATDGVARGRSVYLSVCVLVTFVIPADAIEGLNRVDPRNHVLDGVQIFQGEGAIFGGYPVNSKASAVSAASSLQKRSFSTPGKQKYRVGFRLAGVTLKFPRRKKPSRRCGLLSKLFDHLLSVRKYLTICFWLPVCRTLLSFCDSLSSAF